MIQIAPSILSADFTRIGEAVKLVEDAGADLIHVDIMDGHFVPNLTFGPQLVASLKEKTRLPLDVHLMVQNPDRFIPLFEEAGADWISIHQEASAHLHRDVMLIKQANRKAGLVLNPATPIHLLNEIISELDYILIMSVNPGRGAQKFIPASFRKIEHLKTWIQSKNLQIPIEVDGGVNLENMEDLARHGAEIFVAGNAIFKSKDPRETILKMKEIARKYSPR
jgi:ribulose-phosphate 3-epimerase